VRVKAFLKSSPFEYLLLILLALTCFTLPAYADSVVVPSAFQATEASSGQFSTLGSAARTLQFAYDSSQLGSLTAGSVITGLSFRLDGGMASNPSLSYSSYDIRLSTSLNNPGSLSSTFANNVGADVVLVRSGPLTFAAGSFPGGVTPNAFGPVIAFTTLYPYTGGDLLLTIRHTGNGAASQFVDAVPNTSGLYQGLGADTDTATTELAGFVTNAPIVQFTTAPVPEPATFSLLLVGMLVFLAISKLKFRLKSER